ncbi:MAG: hypothetical protein Kow00121_21590 [Elainellaceae cyanobacterium]
MDAVRKITDDLAIAGQVTSEQLQQMAYEGYRSVLNLRSPCENASFSQEQQQVVASGMRYAYLLIDVEAMTTEVAAKVLQQIDELPKPILVYGSSAVVAAAMVLMHIAMRQGESLQQAFQRAERFGLFEIKSSETLTSSVTS